MTYNIAGLLEPFSSAPSPRRQATEQISCYVNAFDIVNVQEDFNYHAALYDTCNRHPPQNRTPTTGGMGFGSGLNTMSYFSFEPAKRVTWKNCSGVDCLTPKGFTLTTVRLEQGTYLDVYNLHAQAQNQDKDAANRRANIQQLLDYINEHSSQNAILIMGDTNTRYERRSDNMERFIEAGFKDVWVELYRNGALPPKVSESNDNPTAKPLLSCHPVTTSAQCEIVDKVLYRDNRYLTLTPLYYVLREDDINQQGQKLSDHPPVAVHWLYTTNPMIQISDPIGGGGGNSFNHVNSITNGNNITRIAIRTGARVDQVELTMSDNTVYVHGAEGGNPSELILHEDEYLTDLAACVGTKNGSNRIFYISFTTNHDRTLFGGNITDYCEHWSAPSGWQIQGLHGRSGQELDQVGVIYSPL
ncbi:MAG: jacalin-like lectin [Gammaproteobacteria bacterium]